MNSRKTEENSSTLTSQNKFEKRWLKKLDVSILELIVSSLAQSNAIWLVISKYYNISILYLLNFPYFKSDLNREITV